MRSACGRYFFFLSESCAVAAGDGFGEAEGVRGHSPGGGGGQELGRGGHPAVRVRQAQQRGEPTHAPSSYSSGDSFFFFFFYHANTLYLFVIVVRPGRGSEADDPARPGLLVQGTQRREEP